MNETTIAYNSQKSLHDGKGIFLVEWLMLNFSIANYRRVLDKPKLGAGIKCET